MVLNYKKLEQYAIPDVRMSIDKRDVMLYAVGVGLGADPTDERQLRFVYEKSLAVLPTMATVIAAPHAWMKKAAVGSSGKSVHAGLDLRLHRPIPSTGNFICKSTLGPVIDKGPGKAALVTTNRIVYLEGDPDPVYTIYSTSMQRGDGGFGGSTGPEAPVMEPPATPPDYVVEIPTLPQSALIYRLSGDYNPLHADPELARDAGFSRPILHGLCTYGVAGHALLSACCDYDETRLLGLSARFSRPVYPGDRLSVRIWRDGDMALFNVVVVERNNEAVLTYGQARLGPSRV